MRSRFLLVYLTFLLIYTSCGPSRNLVYFSDLPESSLYETAIQSRPVPIIQADDLLSITLSSLNAESNTLFNSGVLPSGTGSGSGTSLENLGYQVDQNGEINFPFIGKVKLAGLTRSEAIRKMQTELSKYVKNPIINLKYLNFKVTVIGEVNNPSLISLPTENVNILQAIGMAGDLTTFGRRENILLIREKDGVRKAVRLNLNKKELFDSPYFYLQQNDVVYVEPDKAKAAQTSLGRANVLFAASMVSLLITIFSIITR